MPTKNDTRIIIKKQQMNSTRIYYINHNGKADHARLDNRQIEQWLNELSVEKRESVKRLVHEDDQLASLLATRLLKMGAIGEAVDDFFLCDVDYPKSGKPYWVSKQGNILDFNISHSNTCVVVALSTRVKVGIDVERVRELKNLSFKMVMSPEELSLIQQTPNLFFKLWSKKEAVVKAANTSGIARMRDVTLTLNEAKLDGENWHLTSIKMDELTDKQYEVYLATSKPVDKLIVKNICFDELIKNTDGD